MPRKTAPGAHAAVPGGPDLESPESALDLEPDLIEITGLDQPARLESGGVRWNGIPRSPELVEFGIGVGVQQADGDRLDAGCRECPGERPCAGLVERRAPVEPSPCDAMSRAA